jgi:uncharacterized protein
MSTDPFDRLAQTKTILLTTYRRDGSGVDTPVSIAVEDGRAYFRSWDSAWKAKRLARNPAAAAAPSTLRGQRTGPAIHGHARLLEGRDARRAAKALARRHRLLHRLLVPLTHRLMRYRTIHYEFVPGP